MGSLSDLERRVSAAAPRVQRQPDAHRRRIAVRRFEQDRARALADPDCSAVRRARLTAAGGMTVAALAALSGVSRDTIRRAEQNDPRVSDAVWRRLASALGVRVKDVRP